MRIISYNVNGLRAAFKKGFIDWLKTNPADIICLQETKATKDDIDIKQLDALGFHHHWFSAHKKGYSGVAVFSKIKPDQVITGNGHKESDDEGRVIQLDFGDIRLINAYFPSGTSGDLRQQFKYTWLDELQTWLDKLKKKHPKMRENNKGWRIDYITVTAPLKDQLVDADIFPDVKHSDHCPVFLELKP